MAANIIYKINDGTNSYNIVSSAYCVCTTGAGEKAKVAYLQNDANATFTLATGVTIYVHFKYTNTATSPTLNVNNTGAKTIMRYCVGTSSSTVTPVGNSILTSWYTGSIVPLTYDGNYWVMATGILDIPSHASSGTSYGAGTTSNYGHVKIQNGDLHTKTHTDGVAAGLAHTHSLYFTTAEAEALDLRKQETLVSGTNIKTINGNSILGSGNITISGGGTTDSEKVKVSKIEHREDSTKYYKIGLISPGNSSTGGNLSVTSAEMAYLPGLEISSAGYMLGSSLKLSNSLYVGGDSSSSAFMVDGTNRSLSCSGNITVNNGYYLKLNKISAPTSSNGTTYGYGSNGQVLKSNGSTVYWASDSTGTDNDKKTSSSNSTSKLYLVGATSQSTSGQTTYSNVGCYTQSGALYSGSQRVVTGDTSGSNTPYSIVTITQANYNALSTKNANTLYIII
jgi:hypothetical protein